MVVFGRISSNGVKVCRMAGRIEQGIADVCGKYGIGPDLLEVLAAVSDRGEGATGLDVQNALSLEPKSVRSATGKLARGGFLTTGRISGGYRTLSLTDSGRDAVRDLEKAVKEMDAIASRGMNEEEIKEVTRLLDIAYYNYFG